MKRLNKISIIVLTVILTGLFFNSVFAQNIENKDGVRIVHNEKNGKWGNDPKIEFKFIGTLGDYNAEDDNFLFYLPEGIVQDSKGNVYVMDAGNHRIQKFDQRGMYRDTFGGEGEGPGEFQLATCIDIDQDDKIFVSEGYVRDMEIFSTEGSVIKSKNMQDQLSTFRLLNNGKIVAENGGGFFFGDEDEKEEDNKFPKLFKITDLEEEVHTRFGEMEFVIDKNTTSGANSNSFTVDNNNNIYVSYTFLNKIEKYSPDGKLLMKIDRPLNFKVKIEKTEVKRDGNSVSVRGGDKNYITKAIDVDDKGRIWNITYRRQEKKDEKISRSMSISSSDDGGTQVSRSIDGDIELRETDLFEIEIFDTEGILLYKFPIDHFVDGIRIFGDTIYLIDSYRGNQFYKYQIIEK